MLLAATDGRNPVYFEDHVTDLTRRIAMSLLFTELNSSEITEFINRTLRASN